MLNHVTATRYVTPLREGGSLPGLMEADNFGTYVVKFRGAGQGRKALVAEIISGELARALGLAIPELVTVTLDQALAISEPDQEVQELLRASHGLNLGMDFLPGALDFDPHAFPVDKAWASQVLWFDALVFNVDRSWRNPNLLYWHGKPHLIDHGATLTFQHNWATAEKFATRSYNASDHVLAGSVTDLATADAALAPLITKDLLSDIMSMVPTEWLSDEPGFSSDTEIRQAYGERLYDRFSQRATWLVSAQESLTAKDNIKDQPRGHNRPNWLTRGGTS